MRCPYCGSNDISELTRICIDDEWMTVRQCFDCFRVFRPDGTKIGGKQDG